ncbi:hypothetical protein ES708_17850 [subsurface metagenome]
MLNVAFVFCFSPLNKCFAFLNLFHIPLTPLLKGGLIGNTTPPNPPKGGKIGKKKCGKKKEKNLNGKRKMAVKKKDFHRGKKRKTNNPARPPTTEAHSKEVLPPLKIKQKQKKEKDLTKENL